MAKAKRKATKARSGSQPANGGDVATLERQQHSEVEQTVQTDRPGVVAQRVVAPIDRLCRTKADGSATLSEPQRQHAAAVQWREDCERGSGARLPGDELPERVDCSSAPELVTDAQIAASRRYERALVHMGRHCAWVAVDVVIRGHRVQDVAEASGLHHKRLVGMLDVALLALADYYGY